MGQDEAEIALPDREPFSETMWGTNKPPTAPSEKLASAVFNTVWDKPVTWFRG